MFRIDVATHARTHTRTHTHTYTHTHIHTHTHTSSNEKILLLHARWVKLAQRIIIIQLRSKEKSSEYWKRSGFKMVACVCLCAPVFVRACVRVVSVCETA